MKKHGKVIDKNYANNLGEKARQFETKERQKSLEALETKKIYNSELNQQIKIEHERKKYEILMTEHERRVNDKQIKAYV